MTHKITNIDIAIVGGGIAGLWAYVRLTNMGYNAVLIEKDAIGSGQTICSQGIIHSGVKYSLNANLSKATSSISDMPKVWNDCLSGCGELDLSNTKINSKEHWMWSKNTISGKLTSFLASKALHGTILHSSAPEWFKGITDVNHVYIVKETVVDVPSLLQNLYNMFPDNIISDEINEISNLTQGNVELKGSNFEIHAKHCLLTTGDNKLAPVNNFSMQTRPLHMVWAKGKLPNLYGHCIEGLSSLPKLTITSHPQTDGENVWYIGGEIAEQGINISPKEQINLAKDALNKSFKNISTDSLEFGSIKITRAEGAQKSGARPDSFVLKSNKNISVLWPTKLALTPIAVSEFINSICRNIELPKQPMPSLAEFDKPKIAIPYWESKHAR